MRCDECKGYDELEDQPGYGKCLLNYVIVSGDSCIPCTKYDPINEVKDK